MQSSMSLLTTKRFAFKKFRREQSGWAPEGADRINNDSALHLGPAGTIITASTKIAVRDFEMSYSS